jgi:hypothetical protein
LVIYTTCLIKDHVFVEDSDWVGISRGNIDVQMIFVNIGDFKVFSNLFLNLLFL